MEKVIRGSEKVYYETPCRLWWNKDSTKLVKDGDPEAAILYVSAGNLIPEVTAIEFGLVKGKKKSEETETPEGTVYPYHTGGGWYLLSNGEKIKGKVAAIGAEEALSS